MGGSFSKTATACANKFSSRAIHFVCTRRRVFRKRTAHCLNTADRAAGSAEGFEVVKYKIPSIDLKHFIKLSIDPLGQKFWNFCDTNKLYSINTR